MEQAGLAAGALLRSVLTPCGRQVFISPFFRPAVVKIRFKKTRKQPVVEGMTKSSVQREIRLRPKDEMAVGWQQGNVHGFPAPGLGHGLDAAPAFDDLRGHVNGPGSQQGFPVGGGQVFTVGAELRSQRNDAVRAQGLSALAGVLNGMHVRQRLRRKSETLVPGGKKLLLLHKTPHPGGPMRLRFRATGHAPENKYAAFLTHDQALSPLSRSDQCNTVSSSRSRRARMPMTSS